MVATFGTGFEHLSTATPNPFLLSLRTKIASVPFCSTLRGFWPVCAYPFEFWRLTVSYHLSTALHVYSAEAMPGTETVLVEAVRPARRQNSLQPESFSQYIQCNKNLNNGNVFCSLQGLRRITPRMSTSGRSTLGAHDIRVPGRLIRYA